MVVRYSLLLMALVAAVALALASGTARAQEQVDGERFVAAEVLPFSRLLIGQEDLKPADGDALHPASQFSPSACPEEPERGLLQGRLLKYTAMSLRHKLSGLASYYSRSLDGTLTATGEIFRNKRFTAAHLTLPLGTWIEVTSRATGKKIRVRVNDRGPYARKFVLDLSKAAAHALGVDIAEDRHVEVRVIALPGEEPLPEGWESEATAVKSAAASAPAAAPATAPVLPAPSAKVAATQQ